MTTYRVTSRQLAGYSEDNETVVDRIPTVEQALDVMNRAMVELVGEDVRVVMVWLESVSGPKAQKLILQFSWNKYASAWTVDIIGSSAPYRFEGEQR